MKQKKENRKQCGIAAPLGRRTKILVVSGNPAVHVQRAVYYCPIHWDLQVDGCHI